MIPTGFGLLRADKAACVWTLNVSSCKKTVMKPPGQVFHHRVAPIDDEVRTSLNSFYYCPADFSAESSIPNPYSAPLAVKCCHFLQLPKSGQVEAVKIHHLGPRRHKVMHEPLY